MIGMVSVRSIHFIVVSVLAGCASPTHPLPGTSDAGSEDGALGDAESPADGSAVVADCGESPAYRLCRTSTTEAHCARTGGDWIHAGGFVLGHCVCPTGQGGCPCARGSACIGVCSAPGSREPECNQLRSGTCSDTDYASGCQCIFGPDPGITNIPADGIGHVVCFD